jgi:hypothetical protein
VHATALTNEMLLRIKPPEPEFTFLASRLSLWSPVYGFVVVTLIDNCRWRLNILYD